MAKMEKVISNIAIRKSKKSLEKTDVNKLHMPLISMAKNIGKKYKLK
jgi:hypothetical protein